MIDVPVKVKDALREGSYRKNYRFKVFHNETYPTYTNLASFNQNSASQTIVIPKSRKYYLYSADSARAFDRVSVVAGSAWIEPCPQPTEGQTETNMEVTLPDGKTTITLSGIVEGATIVLRYETGTAERTLDDFVIDNNNLVSESVSLDERMVSGDTLKFGLCEGSSLEFQYFGLANITGKRIQAFIDVEYGENEPYSIPMGFYTVNKCSRQASTGIIKVTAYNKLMSDYLDQKANQLILNAYNDKGKTVSVYDIKHLLLTDYAIEPYEEIVTSYATWGYGLSQDDASATKFNSIIGDKGPINPIDACDWVSAPTAEFKLYVHSSCVRAVLDASKHYRIDSLYDLDTLERTFYEYLYNVVDMADTNINTNTYMNNLITKGYGEIPATTVQGWKRIMAILLTKEDDSIEVYSLYYPNSEGSMSDLCKTLFTGYKEIQIWFPSTMGVWSTQVQDDLFNFYGEDLEYEYIVSRTTLEVETAIGTYPSFKYPDGKIIERNMTTEALDNITIVEVDSLDAMDLTKIDLSTLPDVTLRDLQSAVYETVCQYGQLDRETDLFSGVELNHSRLLPQETLYPDNALYPSGAKASGFKSMYSKLWADEGNIHKWKYLIITYKGLDGEGNEKEYTLQRTVNADGTDNYNCSDNWLFRNLVWTAEQIGEYADAMVAKMRDITWFPFEMWAVGLPYLETGDEIEIPLGETTYTSYVLQRQLKGIQNLQDTYINGTLDIF